MQAIEEFKSLDKPLNVSIALIGLCDSYIEKGLLEDAWSACEESLENAHLSHMQRGIGDCNLFFSLILSEKSEYEEAYNYWVKAESKFRELDIDEGRTYRAGAKALAGLGRIEDAIKMINKGIEVSKDFPYERAQLYLLRYTVESNDEDKDIYIQILKEIGAKKRLEIN
jgi:tetratricopeptide (TPR) repeat protein